MADTEARPDLIDREKLVLELGDLEAYDGRHTSLGDALLSESQVIRVIRAAPAAEPVPLTPTTAPHLTHLPRIVVCPHCGEQLSVDAPPADPVEGLDPERLARAMSRLAEVGPPAHLDIRDAEEHWPSYLVEARDLAAEYSALRATSSDGQDLDPRRIDPSLDNYGNPIRQRQDRPARDPESPAP